MSFETKQAEQPGALPDQAARPRILVIGLGNPILGDDGVGWQVCQQVQTRLASSQLRDVLKMTTQDSLEADGYLSVEFDCLSLGGLSLMERMVGYTHAIIIDAIMTQTHPTGAILRFNLQELPNSASGRLASAHDTSLQNALQVGRMMGAQLPGEIVVVGIETQAVFDFSETLTEAAAAAIPQASMIAIQQIQDWLQS